MLEFNWIPQREVQYHQQHAGLEAQRQIHLLIRANKSYCYLLKSWYRQN